MDKIVSADKLLTTDEVATLLRVKPRTINAWTRSGKLTRLQFGRKYLYRLSEINKILGTDIKPEWFDFDKEV